MSKANANEEYSSTIIESLKELTGKEKVRFKDLTASKKIDEEVTETANRVKQVFTKLIDLIVEIA